MPLRCILASDFIALNSDGHGESRADTALPVNIARRLWLRSARYSAGSSMGIHTQSCPLWANALHPHSFRCGCNSDRQRS
jgi:hypothetical protein